MWRATPRHKSFETVKVGALRKGGKIMYTKPKSNKLKPACDRCWREPGEFVWLAADAQTGKHFPELRFCRKCVDALRTCILNGRRKNVPVPVSPRADREYAERFASQAPLPRPSQAETSSADEVPIRRT
jgi:hypothetical protein